MRWEQDTRSLAEPYRADTAAPVVRLYEMARRLKDAPHRTDAQAVWQGCAESRAPNYIIGYGSTMAAELLCFTLALANERP